MKVWEDDHHVPLVVSWSDDTETLSDHLTLRLYDQWVHNVVAVGTCPLLQGQSMQMNHRLELHLEENRPWFYIGRRKGG